MTAVCISRRCQRARRRRRALPWTLPFSGLGDAAQVLEDKYGILGAQFMSCFAVCWAKVRVRLRCLRPSRLITRRSLRVSLCSALWAASLDGRRLRVF